MLVGKDTLLAHLNIEENGILRVETETSDEGVVGEDIGVAYLVENGKGIGAREGRKGKAVKKQSCEN